LKDVKRTFEGQITFLSVLPRAEFFVVGTREGTIEIYKASLFNLSYSCTQTRISSGELNNIVAISTLENKNPKFIVSTTTGEISMVELVHGKFSIEVQVSTLLEKFYSNENSISIKVLKQKEICVAIFLNAKGFMLLSLEPVVQKLHEIKLENDGHGHSNFFSLITELKEIENGRIAVTFFVNFESLLRVYYCEFDLDNGCLKFHLKKTFSGQLRLRQAIKFNKSLVLGVTQDFEIVYISLKDFDLVGKATIADNIDEIRRIKGKLVLKTIDSQKKLQKTLEAGFWLIESYTIEEYVKNIINNGHYISALSLSLSLTRESQNLLLFKKKGFDEEKTRSLLITVSMSYYKFIVQSLPFNKVTKDSMRILIEFLYKSKIMEVLNEIYEDLSKYYLDNGLTFMIEATIDFITDSQHFKFDQLKSTWLIKIIAALFTKERSHDVLSMILENDFSKIEDLGDIVLMLKTLSLKLPLLKLLIVDLKTDSHIIMTIFTIYVKQNRVDQFGSIILLLLSHGSIGEFKPSAIEKSTISLITDFFVRQEVLEIYCCFRQNYISIFCEMYPRFYSSFTLSDVHLKKSNDSLLYNVFRNQKEVIAPFNFFIEIIEKNDFGDFKQIDLLFCLCSAELFVRSVVPRSSLNAETAELILMVVFKGSIENNCGEEYLKTMALFLNFASKEGTNPEYQGLLEKFSFLAESNEFYEFWIEIEFLRRNLVHCLKIWKTCRSKIPHFDVFDWITRVYALKVQGDLKSFTKVLLCDLRLLVEISPFKTSEILRVIPELTLKDLEYLKPYPDLIILKIQEEIIRGNDVDSELQLKYLSLLHKRRPELIIPIVKNYRLDLDLTVKFAEKINDLDLLLVLKAKFGYNRDISDLIFLQIGKMISGAVGEVSTSTFSKFYFVMQEFVETLIKTQSSDNLVETFSRIHKIINEAQGLRDLDYWRLKTLTNRFFIDGIVAVKGDNFRSFVGNINHFIDLDVTLIKILLENFKRDTKFTKLISNIQSLDILEIAEKRKNTKSRGVSNIVMTRCGNFKVRKVDRTKFASQAMYHFEKSYEFKYMDI
jgi:hypothetical protein